MKKYLMPICLIVFFTVTTAHAEPKFFPADDDDCGMPNQYTVRLKEGVAINDNEPQVATELTKFYGGKVLYVFHTGFYIETNEIIAYTISQDPRVSYVSQRWVMCHGAIVGFPEGSPCTSRNCPYFQRPTRRQKFSYPPVIFPVESLDPNKAKPIGVGPVAEGGDTFELRVALTQFYRPVNIYLTIYAPSIDPDIWMLKSDLSLQPLSERLIRWKTNTTGPVDKFLFGYIPVNDLPSGTYYLALLVTPMKSFEKYYFWLTYFEIS